MNDKHKEKKVERWEQNSKKKINREITLEKSTW